MVTKASAAKADSKADKVVTREEFDALREEFDILKKSKGEKKVKTQRKPTAYNLYLAEEMKRIREAYVKEGKTDIDHKEVFKKAVEEWKNRKSS